MTEKEFYDAAVQDMNARGRFKLANWLAHEYEIKEIIDNMVYLISDRGRIIRISKNGMIEEVVQDDTD